MIQRSIILYLLFFTVYGENKNHRSGETCVGKNSDEATKQLRVTELGKGLGENKTKSETKRRGNKLTQKTKTKTTEQLKRHRKTNGQNEKNKTKDTERTHEKTKII